MTLEYPLISCICVTHSRISFLATAINCFQAQDYPYKEMIISYPVNDTATKNFLNNQTNLQLTNIVIILRADNESVGNARNIAINNCHGDYICVWDDDDWYHPSRLSSQYDAMINIGKCHACVLTSLILFDKLTRKAYISSQYTWENTLLCRKEVIMQNQYAHRNKGEDTHIIQFLEKKKYLHHVEDAPFLYIYIYHGTNTWERAHYEHLISKGAALSKELNNQIIKLLI
jgi:glycosyltransferase involved in cell wall biosynthesis